MRGRSFSWREGLGRGDGDARRSTMATLTERRYRAVKLGPGAALLLGYGAAIFD